MKKIILLTLIAAAFTWNACAQTGKKVYDESLNQMTQINEAVAKAAAEGKFVIAQVGGNWCPWCLKFADFITRDAGIAKVIADDFVYIHVNYHPRKSAPEGLMERLGYPGRFGYPVFVVLDGKGKVVHIQDRSLLEAGDGYDREKVLSFFRHWTPAAVRGE